MNINTKTSHYYNYQLLPSFSYPWSCNASVAPAARWFKSMHTIHLLSFSLLMKAMWSQEQLKLAYNEDHNCSATMAWHEYALHLVHLNSLPDMSLQYALNTLINCVVNLKPLFRAPLCLCTRTVNFALLPVSCTNSRDYVADEVKHLDCASFPNTCRIKHLDDNC